MCVAVFLDWMGGIATILSDRLGVVKNFCLFIFFVCDWINYQFIERDKKANQDETHIWIKQGNYTLFLSYL